MITTNCFLAYLFYTLSRRMEAIEYELLCLATNQDNSDLVNALQKYCDATILSELAPEATHRGLASIDVRYRDHQDRFQTIGELIREISSKVNSQNYAGLIELVKMFYKLEYALDAQPELGDQVLKILQYRLEKNKSSRTIGSIQRVHRGQRCDTQIMSPVRNGSHVEQPLGFVIYTTDMKLMHKAEVICR
jgi:hypothetical protein